MICSFCGDEIKENEGWDWLGKVYCAYCHELKRTQSNSETDGNIMDDGD